MLLIPKPSKSGSSVLYGSHCSHSPPPPPPPPPPHPPPSLPSSRMSEVAQTASKKPIRVGVHNLVLDMCCSDESGEDVDVPYIKYSF